MEFQKENMNKVRGENWVNEKRDSNLEHQPRVVIEQGCGREELNG